MSGSLETDYLIVGVNSPPLGSDRIDVTWRALVSAAAQRLQGLLEDVPNRSSVPAAH